MAGCGLLSARLVKLSIVATTSNSLASSTKETLHTVQIPNVLGSLVLRLTLAVVDFLVVTLILKITTVITESVIRTAAGAV